MSPGVFFLLFTFRHPTNCFAASLLSQFCKSFGFADFLWKSLHPHDLAGPKAMCFLVQARAHSGFCPLVSQMVAISISVSCSSLFSRLVINAFAVSIAVSTFTPVSIAFLRIIKPSWLCSAPCVGVSMTRSI